MNNVEPRFRAVSPDTLFEEKIGYGWARQGRREAGALAPAPYLEVRAVAKEPQSLPRDVLFRDYIRGEGDQIFMVKAPAAQYEVSFLAPDRTVRTEMVESSDGLLRIRFPRGDWIVSGVIVKGPRSRLESPPLRIPPRLPRPAMIHEPPTFVEAGKPLPLSLKVEGTVASIRLHYRPVNQTVPFKTLESTDSFVIPGEDISARWDLMYYFEVLNAERSGWFYPDPATATPYFVVATRP